MIRSLHALVQDCSRAIASYASPEAAFQEIERIVVRCTGAISAEVLMFETAGFLGMAIARQAFDERRVCLVIRGEAMIVAAPIKNASRVFGALTAIYSSDAERISGGHATSELVNAVAQTLGNALALAEKVPQGSSAVLNSDHYEHYLRAHFELYRSFHVPFTIALYDLRHYPSSSRIPHAVALRWTVRKSDVVFEIEDGIFVVLLGSCPLACSRVVTERIEQVTGFTAQALTAPRRGESLRRLRARSMSSTSRTEVGASS